MAFDELQQQQIAITELLNQLIVLHKRVLWDDTTPSQLDKVRNDISISINDLCLLNDRFISHDGEIKEEIDSLTRCKARLAKLHQKEKKLLAQRREWAPEGEVTVEEDNSDGEEVSAVKVRVTYRKYLNRYIEMVGVGNTSLSIEQDDESVEPASVLASAKLLSIARKNLQGEIHKLESLLLNLKKDDNFLKEEMRSQAVKMRTKESQIDKKLDDLNQEREKIFFKCGLSVPKDSETLGERLLQLTFSRDEGHRFKEQFMAITEAAPKIIDLKISSLQEELNHKKESSSSLLSERNCWNDCVHLVTALEHDLSESFGNNAKAGIPFLRVLDGMKKTLVGLDALLANSMNDKIRLLISDEKDAILEAYNELNAQNVVTNAPAREEPPLAEKNKQKRHHPFLSVGKSTPRIGLTPEVIDSRNHTNPSNHKED
ncbi:hypothetical protein KAFR_0A05590 [Kazachstania africana CBS 2517]|uniref:Uncharacterized protein n=1 Tax=Kazachstania africana (strain ATCC 22294 / BCRC 22015 / CBS 2517 / CECT 1963 / NBRC 1671 / NRRL Y-8276) TaxID=1071382 RepID=H2ANP4_KAZAF|nr:hypothetical protein KAFR_0A05590 [Kazachstania africana CBS 2517]CCF55994.1 hypothetical protein KAFR_0A05590 [Kazachstania africana CBS 2517]